MATELSKRQLQRKKDRQLISRVLGRELGSHEIVHHHTYKVIILCKSGVQHKLIHREIVALEACGHRDWRKCKYCQIHDDPSNLYINSYNIYHRRCARNQRRLERQFVT